MTEVKVFFLPSTLVLPHPVTAQTYPGSKLGSVELSKHAGWTAPFVRAGYLETQFKKSFKLALLPEIVQLKLIQTHRQKINGDLIIVFIFHFY